MTPGEVAPADVTTTPTAPPAPKSEPVAPAESAPAAPADDDYLPGEIRRLQVVGFTFTDTITGKVLDGLGVVVDVPEDGAAVCIAPIQSNYLFVSPEAVQVVELDG